MAFSVLFTLLNWLDTLFRTWIYSSLWPPTAIFWFYCAETSTDLLWSSSSPSFLLVGFLTLIWLLINLLQGYHVQPGFESVSFPYQHFSLTNCTSTLFFLYLWACLCFAPIRYLNWPWILFRTGIRSLVRTAAHDGFKWFESCPIFFSRYYCSQVRRTNNCTSISLTDLSFVLNRWLRCCPANWLDILSRTWNVIFVATHRHSLIYCVETSTDLALI